MLSLKLYEFYIYVQYVKNKFYLYDLIKFNNDKYIFFIISYDQ
jgi:hypothetical protein